MKILYIKTISIVIFILLILFPAIYLWFGFLYQKSDKDINQFLSKGALQYIESVLINTPKKDWQNTLIKLSPKNSLATVSHIDALPLNKTQKTQLLNGKTIYTNSGDYLFLYYGLSRAYVYKRIGNTEYAIKMPLGESVYTLVQSNTIWMISIIDHELYHHSQKDWPHVIKQMQKQFGVDLKIESKNNLSKDIRNQLKIHPIAFSQKTGTDHISIVYAPLNKSHIILKMSPFDGAPATEQFSVFQHYFFWIFAVIGILIVLYLTKIFSKNVRKIDELTTHFSHGEFDHHTHISRFSILKDIHTNIVNMGNKIHALIKSQQNMTRFVAHEIRTPLSTMQLALDALKKDRNISHIDNIQEDIDNISKLISTFLLYSQMTTHELKLKKENVNFVLLLEKIIQRFQTGKIAISLDCKFDKNATILIDPNLLKHAIDNMLTNALKFAKKEISISAEIKSNQLIIHIDDDGPGIPKNEIKNIFTPFTTLSDQHDFGKHIGLGLTIAKNIIDMHGGIIQVDKSPLGGARFSVFIQF